MSLPCDILLGIEIHCGEEQSMCEAGVDHVVQILRVCGFSVIQHYPRADLLVFVRDHQHFDLGGFIKVQVGNKAKSDGEPLHR